jgi:alkyl hydroperoxide reductase subunit AhpC
LLATTTDASKSGAPIAGGSGLEPAGADDVAGLTGSVLPLVHDADGDVARNYDVSHTSVYVIRPHGYLALAARGVVDTDELVRRLEATFR